MDRKSLNYFLKFFKNRGLSFATSNSDLRGLVDDLFRMVEKNFSKNKSKLQVLFQSPIIKINSFLIHKNLDLLVLNANDSQMK